MGFRKSYYRKDGTFVEATTTNTLRGSSGNPPQSTTSKIIMWVFLAIAVGVVIYVFRFLFLPNVDSTIQTLSPGDSLFYKGGSKVSNLQLFQEADVESEKKKYLSKLKRWEKTKYEKEGGKSFAPLMLNPFEIKQDEFYKHSTSFVGTFEKFDTVPSKYNGNIFIRIKRNPKLKMTESLGHYKSDGRQLKKGLYVSVEDITAMRQDTLYK